MAKTRGIFRNLSRGGLHFFPGGAQHPLGPENPLKSIDFTGPWGSLAPIAYPPWKRLWQRLNFFKLRSQESKCELIYLFLVIFIKHKHRLFYASRNQKPAIKTNIWLSSYDHLTDEEQRGGCQHLLQRKGAFFLLNKKEAWNGLIQYIRRIPSLYYSQA